MFLGVDEAGRGPVLGPLVIAGLVSEDQEGLKALGVRDSKELSPSRREELFEHLVRDHHHCILIIPADSVDLCRKTMTLNQLEVVGFASVILSILLGRNFDHPAIKGEIEIISGGKRGSVKHILLDAADVDEERFGEGITSELKRFTEIGGIGVLSRHKADRDHPVVGAASILAKVTRDAKISEIMKRTGFEIGSGYPGDPVTKAFLSRYIKDNGVLPPFARASWETSRKLIIGKSQKSIFDFY